MNDIENKDPDAREALIPWYVTGNLSAAERASVEAYLAEHPLARLQLKLAGEEADAALLANETIDPPSRRMLDRLMADVEAQDSAARERPGIVRRIIEALSVFMPTATPLGLRAAGIAAVLLIAVQAGFLVWLTAAPRTDAGIGLAAGDVQTPAGRGIMLAFQDDAPAAAIAGLLQSIDAQIVEGPKPGGVFVLGFAGRDLSETEIGQILDMLKTRSAIVKFAVEAK